jgi:hypothetical protein
LNLGLIFLLLPLLALQGPQAVTQIPHLTQELKSIVMYDDSDSVYSGLGPKGEQLARLLDEVRSEKRKCLIFAHEIREMDAIVEICKL